MKSKYWICILMLGLTLTACGSNQSDANATSASQVASSTPVTSPTPDIPYVALVDGEGVREVLYDANLMQLEKAIAQGSVSLPEGTTAEQQILDELIDLTLLSRAARAAGFHADDGVVDERIAQITQQLGSDDELTVWMEENGYDNESFQLALTLEIEAAWQRDKIAAAVPLEAEQVRARQILFYDPYLAERAYEQLEQGSPIEAILASADPQNQGYLDWVPRGYLLIPELDDALFDLQPGQFSQVIETDLGYHILYVIERQDNRPLTDDALLTLQAQSLQHWLQEQRNQIEIEIMVTQ